jgi:hypothetical protein
MASSPTVTVFAPIPNGACVLHTCALERAGVALSPLSE